MGLRHQTESWEINVPVYPILSQRNFFHFQTRTVRDGMGVAVVRGVEGENAGANQSLTKVKSKVKRATHTRA
jgi:hypothetical protein